MSEFIAVMDGNSINSVTEHSFNRRVPGETAFVRQRIIEALESFNYVVLSEDPLLAKRDGSFSINVLDCGLKVIVTFRQSTPASTTATFNYTIPVSMVTKGDLHSVEREAEALIAVALSRQTASVCLICGANYAADSRFCRGCGAPNAGSYPAELEVMRLTAGARAGHQTIVAGVVVLLSILALALPLIMFGRPRRELVGWVLLVLGQVAGWSVLLYGILRLHRAVNPKTITRPIAPTDGPRSIPTFEPAALRAQPAWSSITEGTTELLDAQRVERTGTTVERANADTGAIK